MRKNISKTKTLERIRRLDLQDTLMLKSYIKVIRRTQGANPDDQKIHEFLDRLQKFYETGVIEFG